MSEWGLQGMLVLVYLPSLALSEFRTFCCPYSLAVPSEQAISGLQKDHKPHIQTSFTSWIGSGVWCLHTTQKQPVQQSQSLDSRTRAAWRTEEWIRRVSALQSPPLTHNHPDMVKICRLNQCGVCSVRVLGICSPNKCCVSLLMVHA